MLKWLMITTIVLLGFVSVLLALGYLLTENEKATTALVSQLAQQKQTGDGSADNVTHGYQQLLNNSGESLTVTIDHQILTAENSTVLTFEQTVINNLTCVLDQQCLIAKVSFTNRDCVVAVNIIGASLLAKLATESEQIGSCRNYLGEEFAHCQKNTCVLTEN